MDAVWCWCLNSIVLASYFEFKWSCCSSAGFGCSPSLLQNQPAAGSLQPNGASSYQRAGRCRLELHRTRCIATAATAATAVLQYQGTGRVVPRVDKKVSKFLDPFFPVLLLPCARIVRAFVSLSRRYGTHAALYLPASKISRITATDTLTVTGQVSCSSIKFLVKIVFFSRTNHPVVLFHESATK